MERLQLEKLEKEFKNISLEEVQKRIEKLRRRDLSDIDFKDLKELVRPLLVKCLVLGTTFPKHLPIFRSRILERDQEIKSISEISAPPVSDETKINRASTGAMRIFYGSVSEKSENGDLGHVTTIFELSKIHNPNFSDPYERIVIGQWFSEEDFTIATIGLDSDIAPNNKNAIKIKKDQQEIFKQIPGASEIVTPISKFMSDEFSKDVKESHEYKISAAYGELLFLKHREFV